MYKTLGYEWASSLLGFLSLLLVPIPFIMFRHGRTLRKRSPWAVQHMDDLGEDEPRGAMVQGKDEETRSGA